MILKYYFVGRYVTPLALTVELFTFHDIFPGWGWWIKRYVGEGETSVLESLIKTDKIKRVGGGGIRGGVPVSIRSSRTVLNVDRERGGLARVACRNDCVLGGCRMS